MVGCWKNCIYWLVDLQLNVLGENNEESGIATHGQRTIFGQEGT